MIVKSYNSDYEILDGFKMGEKGYGYDDEMGGLYCYQRTEETDSMNTLFKTPKDAIRYEIKCTEDYLEELKIKLNEYS